MSEDTGYAERQAQWVYLSTRGAGGDEVYGKYRHTPCGTVLQIAQGYSADICPKCDPVAWAKEHPPVTR